MGGHGDAWEGMGTHGRVWGRKGEHVAGQLHIYRAARVGHRMAAGRCEVRQAGRAARRWGSGKDVGDGKRATHRTGKRSAVVLSTHTACWPSRCPGAHVLWVNQHVRRLSPLYILLCKKSGRGSLANPKNSSFPSLSHYLTISLSHYLTISENAAPKLTQRAGHRDAPMHCAQKRDDEGAVCHLSSLRAGQTAGAENVGAGAGAHLVQRLASAL
eukprot:324604-Chlamydomonas_euryale.AAC.1